MNRGISVCFLFVLMIFGCISCDFCEREYTELSFIKSEDENQKFIDHALDSAIKRSNLTLASFNDSGCKFQYLNEDEWGNYFKLLRVSEDGILSYVTQVEETKLFFIFEKTMSASEEVFVDSCLHRLVKNDITYPKMNNGRALDAGDVSIIYDAGDTIHLKHWQETRWILEQTIHDIDTVDFIINKILEKIVEENKEWWQE